MGPLPDRLKQLMPSLPRRLGHQPIRITAPSACVALGAGFAAQALLRPSAVTVQSQLLDALIAPAGVDAVEPDGIGARAQGSAPEMGSALPFPDQLRSHRAEARTEGTALAVPRPGSTLALVIRVALLMLSAIPCISASGPWLAVDRNGN